MPLNDRLRVMRRWGAVLSIGVAIALLPTGVSAEDPCTKLPDLWLPPDGTAGLANGGVSVQETSGDVCQGGEVVITVTIDNLSCGDAGPFDVTVYYDDTAHVIGTQRVDGLPGCEYTTLTFVWDTTNAPTGEHEILACADTGGDVAELNEANNCLTIENDLLVNPNTPLIEAEKTLSGTTYEPGTTVTYKVVLINDGCADQEDNPGHEFVDGLPVGLSATGEATASAGSIEIIKDEIVWDGRVPSGGSVTLLYQAEITGDPGTDICNQGTVHWDSDGDGTNDASELTNDPGTPIDDDPTCFTVSVGPVPPPLAGTIDAPTLSEGGMIVLSCLFVLAFWWRMRRRWSKA